MHQKLKIGVACLMGLLVFGFTGCGNDTTPKENNVLEEKVSLNWSWKRTVNKTLNVIYGTIENKTDTPLARVELEFRTQDKNGKTIQTRIFAIENIDPKAQKPFTQDYPAHATFEDSGFVSVKRVISAN